MSIATTLPLIRQRLHRQLTARATVVRPVGEPTTDRTTGEVTQDTVTIGTGRPCKVKTGDAGGSDKATAGEGPVRNVDAVIVFPLEEDVIEGDIVTVTASIYAPGFVGKSYRVVELDRREWQAGTFAKVEYVLVPPLNEDEEVGS